MPHFLEVSYDGAAVLTTRVKSSCLGFCGGFYYVLERLTKDVDGSVDAFRIINISDVVMDGNAATGFVLHKVSGVRRYLEYHVVGVEANTGVGLPSSLG